MCVLNKRYFFFLNEDSCVTQAQESPRRDGDETLGRKASSQAETRRKGPGSKNNVGHHLNVGISHF